MSGTLVEIGRRTLGVHEREQESEHVSSSSTPSTSFIILQRPFFCLLFNHICPLRRVIQHVQPSNLDSLLSWQKIWLQRRRRPKRAQLKKVTDDLENTITISLTCLSGSAMVLDYLRKYLFIDLMVVLTQIIFRPSKVRAISKPH